MECAVSSDDSSEGFSSQPQNVLHEWFIIGRIACVARLCETDRSLTFDPIPSSLLFFVSVCAVLVGLKDPLPQNAVFAAWEP